MLNEPVVSSPKQPARKPGERRLQILQTLAALLEQPKGERITTALLAKKLDVSEAALYRHFASKAQMFEGLIEFIEQTVFGLVNQICSSEESGLAQVHRIITMLLHFAETNRGMTRVLIGDALVIEDDRLQERMNQFMERIEASLRQSLKVAVAQKSLDGEDDLPARANLLLAFVAGRWLQFAKSGFKKRPREYLDVQLRLLLS